MIRSLDETQVVALAVSEMCLDESSIGMDSPEAIAAAIRRAASFLCPTTARAIVSVVEEALEWLVADSTELLTVVSDTLEALVNYGDLMELADPDEPSRKSARLYLSLPAFVVREAGGVVLVGIPPEGQPIVEPDLAAQVEVEQHVRMIPGHTEPEFLQNLADAGLFELKMDQWLACPRPVSADVLISQFDVRLDASLDPGQVDGLRILDGARPPDYYVGRWRVPTLRDQGRFVARRPRGYGADAWCYVDLRAGSPRKLIDLPISPGLVRACDEAWRLQAAIDARGGHPQVIRHSDSGIVRLAMPPPSWLQRRWDALGKPVAVPGALVAYRFARRELDQEVAFAQTMLWAEAIS